MSARAAEPATAWHALSAEETLRRLHTAPDGLSGAEARARLELAGPNSLPEQRGPSLWNLFLHQFASPLIYILLIAAAISLAIGEAADAYVILVVVLFNALLGVIQEYRAERALAALRELTAPQARVLREGAEWEVPAAEVVPGDVLLLTAGDRVGADARLLAGRTLRIDESAITGESLPVEKAPEPLPVETILPDRLNMLFVGTVVVHGSGRAVVTATGMRSHLGSIARQVETGPETTPLQEQLAGLARRLGVLSLGLVAALVLIGWLRALPAGQLFLTAIAAAVAFIPEGLPAVLTAVLAVGVTRMARRHALIRRLPAVEALGSATVICTDKTGTLTRNEMTVRAVLAAGRRYQVTGAGYERRGQFVTDGGVAEPREIHPLRQLLLAGLLANEAQLRERDGRVEVAGDPTEGALLVAAEKAGLRVAEERAARPLLDEIPFSSELRYMASLRQEPRGEPGVYLKGAPERLLELCAAEIADGDTEPLSPERREQLRRQAEELAAEGMRVLALAWGPAAPGQERLRPKDAESGFVFLGLVGMLDPPRPEAPEAIERAFEAGVRPVMITGDHLVTARAIAAQIGLWRPGDEVLDGRALERLSDAELEERVGRVSVFARVQPEHKLRIVRALQRRGEIVAMTGDGVNDSPALRRANIGVAMGLGGTEVAKAAADIVLTDDNFASIVNAIEEGRVIYANVRRVLFNLLPTNTGEILTLFTGLLIGWPLVLLPVQLLWVNLVTDGFNTVAVGMEGKQADVLRQPPRRPDAPLLDRAMLGSVAYVALFMALGTLGLFWWAWAGEPENLARARTVAFTSIAVFQLWHVLNARAGARSVFSVGLFSNRWVNLALPLSFLFQVAAVEWEFLQGWLGTVPLTPLEWGLILLVTASVWVAEEARKWGLARAVRREGREGRLGN